MPNLDEELRIHYLFLARAVTLMMKAGIRQFVDLGSGSAFVDTLCRVIRRAGQRFRLVCADPDEVIVAQYNRQLAADAFAVGVYADVRYADRFFSNTRVSALLDLAEPIGLVVCAVDARLGGDPHKVMQSYVERLPEGSHMLLSQLLPVTLADQVDALTGVAGASGATDQLTGRNQASIERLFRGLDLLYPGVTGLASWRPDTLVPQGGIERIGPQFEGEVGRKLTPSPRADSRPARWFPDDRVSYGPQGLPLRLGAIFPVADESGLACGAS